MSSQSESEMTEADPQRVSGRVVRVIMKGGYLFIRTPEGKDYFGHHSEVTVNVSKISPGDLVTFVPTEGTKGLRAIEIEWLGAK
jgi:cold shock CspA family protein